jgi:hypothetical protein
MPYQESKLEQQRGSMTLGGRQWIAVVAELAEVTKLEAELTGRAR